MFSKRLAAIAVSGALSVGVAAQAQAQAHSQGAAFEAQIGQAKAAMMANPQQALGHAVQAASLAQAAPPADRATAAATAQWLQAEALVRLNQADKAMPVIEEALAATASAAPRSKLHGDLMLARGGAFAAQNRMDLALRDYQQAHELYRQAGEARGQAKALQNIGSIYQAAGDYPRVLQYYAQSAEAYPGDLAMLVSAHNNTANAYKNMGRLDEAEAEFGKALATVAKMGSAHLEARILANLASTEVLAGRLDAAEAHVAQGLAIADRDPSAREWTPFLWGVMGQSAFKRGRHAQAVTYLGRAFDGVDLSSTPPPFRDFHETAHKVYAAGGDTGRALAHLQAFKRLDDEAKGIMASTNTALMSARFDFANQDLRIARLKADQLQKDMALARSRHTITQVLLGGVTLVLALLVFGVISLRRSRNQVRAANVDLNVANTSLAKALKVKTEFLATTSHEIRTPLNGILGVTQVILADRTVDAGLKEKIGLVHGAGETMRALVDDILDVAKIETGNLTIHRSEIDLARILEDTAALWSEKAAAKGLTLRLDIAGAPGRIVEDGARLRQILFNLMSNAIKFTDQGEVTLAARTQDAAGAEQVVISVTDTGVGIPAAAFDEIFESFRQVDGGLTRQHGGTGLGLTICRSLAQAMGGAVRVESREGQGSTFSLTLPLVRAASAEASGARSAAPAPGGAAILLVEANPLVQALMRAVLQPALGPLEVASSAEAALGALAGRRFDRVVAEGQTLAQAGDPFALTARIVAATEGAPVTMLWTEPSPADRARLAAAGAAQVIAKPISPQGVLEALMQDMAAPIEAKAALTA